MIAVITGIGWITTSGPGYGKGLCKKPARRFVMAAGQLPEISRQSAFDTPFPRFGRMDKFSKLGLSAVALALKDAGQNKPDQPDKFGKSEIGIIVSTFYGCLNTDIDYFNTVIPEKGALASPNLFAYTLPNSFLGEAAIRFGFTGINFVVCENHPSQITGLRMGLESIASGETEKMVTGLCNPDCPPMFARTDKIAAGALFFLLEKETKKKYFHYGGLDLDKDGTILFGKNRINDLTILVNLCLENYRSKGF